MSMKLLLRLFKGKAVGTPAQTAEFDPHTHHEPFAIGTGNVMFEVPEVQKKLKILHSVSDHHNLGMFAPQFPVVAIFHVPTADLKNLGMEVEVNGETAPHLWSQGQNDENSWRFIPANKQGSIQFTKIGYVITFEPL